MPAVPTLGRQRKEDLKFKANLHKETLLQKNEVKDLRKSIELEDSKKVKDVSMNKIGTEEVKTKTQ
jgi:hypothetical protein